MKLLNSIFTRDAVRQMIVGTETFAAIAQHLVEIGERWRWMCV